jgi:alpha-tubulin suppressor-like RCC1 family protein
MSAGDKHACGIDMTGALKCWGKDNDDRKVVPAGSFSRLAVGGDHACALNTDGEILCWGKDNEEQSTPPESP